MHGLFVAVCTFVYNLNILDIDTIRLPISKENRRYAYGMYFWVI